jgi:hypothetical protein
MIKYFLPVLSLTILILIGSCKKSAYNTGSLYTPTSADVTPNATLQELQQGRTLYINNCNSCHGLYSPDDHSPSQWRSIVSTMATQTNLSASEIQLVNKYLSRGKQ